MGKVVDLVVSGTLALIVSVVTLAGIWLIGYWVIVDISTSSAVDTIGGLLLFAATALVPVWSWIWLYRWRRSVRYPAPMAGY